MPHNILMKFLSHRPVYAPDDGAGSFFDAGDGATSTAGGEGGGPAGAGDPPQSQAPAGKPASGEGRPDWLLPKYENVEAQAKAYKDLYGRFSKKTDDLRAEVRAEAVAEYGKTIGVPEDAADYTYPDGFNAPAENVDAALRSWAKEHNVSPEGFQKLVTDVHALTQSNAEAELGKLGDHAQERIDQTSRWIKANIDAVHFPQVAKIMTTAEGVEFFEAMMGLTGESGFVPDTSGEGSAPLTRDSIRALQSDPKFGTDPEYTAMVRKKWSDFANLPESRRK